MACPGSPLQAIHQKELALRRRLEEARRQAESRMQATREEAARNIGQADQEGRAAAEVYYQQEIEQARREAEAVVTAAQEESMALRHQTMDRLNDVAAQIVELVLPMDSFPD